MFKKLFSVSVLSVALIGCGDDDEGGGGGGIDPVAVANRIDNPTGQVTDAAGAQGVANAFGEALQGGTGSFGQRRQQSGIDCDIPEGATSGTFDCTCDEGGTATVSGEGNEQSANVSFEYDNCCYAGCCFNGSGAYAFGQGGAYTFCGSVDIDLECDGNSASASYEYCQGSDGRVWFSVTYESETYSVTGSYTSGVGGTWTIRDADTEWNCTEDAEGAGCCTDGTEEITWGGGTCQ